MPKHFDNNIKNKIDFITEHNESLAELTVKTKLINSYLSIMIETTINLNFKLIPYGINEQGLLNSLKINIENLLKGLKL